MMKSRDPVVSLSKILSSSLMNGRSAIHHKSDEAQLEALQLKMLRVQQGIWHQKKRAIVVFEGFDAAGKGGVIRRLVEWLDPRGYRVYGISEPRPDEQGRHYLYRFWKKLPPPGTIAIFDRSWYGRVLVERVENLTTKGRWTAAYNEINQFESMLIADGVEIIKIFLAITKDEQLQRFEQRINDPYKQWKLSQADLKARSKWNLYVRAVDDMVKYTSTPNAPWHIVPTNDKVYGRMESLNIITSKLRKHARWIEQKAHNKNVRNLKKELKALSKK